MKAAQKIRVGLVVIGLLGALSIIFPNSSFAQCVVSDACNDGIAVTYNLTEQEKQSCTSGAPAGSYQLCCKDDPPGGTTERLYSQRYSASEHASSLFSQKNAVCGTAIETIPQCASCSGITICSGLEAVDKSIKEGKTDNFFTKLQNGEVRPQNFDTDNDGQFWFAGKQYDNQNIYFCKENNFACGNTELADSCTANFDFGYTKKTGVTGGEGESRLWYPHLKLSAALSTIAQSLFNPLGLNDLYNKSAFSKNSAPSNTSGSTKNPNPVVTKIEEHQGVNDPTRVVNYSPNNSSTITGQDAPPPLFSFGNSNHDIYSQAAACVLPEVKNNTGDDLLGPTITAQLVYTQEYKYNAYPKKDGCVPDNANAGLSPERCCSAVANIPPIKIGETCQNLPDGGRVCRGNYKCGTIPKVKIPTKGKSTIFTKVPLVEYIYDTLVVGKDSLFSRFMPNTIAKQEFEEIPSSSKFTASAIGYNQEKSSVTLKAGDGKSTPTIYHPHVGSIAKYWLEDFQKALRPQTTGFTTTNANNQSPDCTQVKKLPQLPPANSSCTSCSLSWPSSYMQEIFESAASFYKVPTSVLYAIFFNEGGLNPERNWSDSTVLSASGPNCQVLPENTNTSTSGAKGPWQFLPSVWNEYKDASLEAGINDGRIPNINNLIDATFAAAKKISSERGGNTSYDSPVCAGVKLNNSLGPSTSCNWSDSDIVTAARQYLGYCEDPKNPDPKYPPRLSCISEPDTCYQNNVLSLGACR